MEGAFWVMVQQGVRDGFHPRAPQANLSSKPYNHPLPGALQQRPPPPRSLP